MSSAWHHVSLAVSDLDAAITFFVEIGSAKLTYLERGMTDQIASLLGLDGARCDLAQLAWPGAAPILELIAFAQGAGRDAPPHPVLPGMAHFAMRVPDLEAATQAAARHGAQVLGTVTSFSDHWAVYVRTPFGVFLEFQQSKERADLGR